MRTALDARRSRAADRPGVLTVRRGSVFQRHTTACPRDGQGQPRPHRCHGPWSYSLLVGYGPDGKRRQVSRSGFPTKRAAQEALVDLLARQDAEIAEVHRLSVASYLGQWLENKRKIRPTTRRGYESHVRLYLRPQLGRILLADLRPHHLDAMYSDLLAGEGRGPATVQRIHATLRTALNAAVKRRLIPWNPAMHVELPAAEKPDTAVWTSQQLGHFLDEVAGHRLYALFHLVALAGLRRGEALGLRWVDIDIVATNLRVVQQLLDTGGELRFGPPKTRSGVRIVPLDAGSIEVLRQHRVRQNEEHVAWGDAWVDRGLVFTRENGEMIRPDYLSHLFVRLATEANLPPIRLHDLRHTSASLALAAGIPMKVVSQRLGHSSIAITADLYTHVVPAVAQDAADRIAAVVPRRAATVTRHEYCESTADDHATSPWRKPDEAKAQVRAGGPRGTRTHNPRIKSPLLCQLS